MNDLYLTLLQEKFKLEAFRPGQQEAMQLLLQKGRLLCIQPTGYGKSLLYQLPSCILGGLTIVISPLLALMRDQIDQLTNRFQIPAATLNSDQTEEENSLTRTKILDGQIQILFVSPELLDHVDRFDFLLQQSNINLLVIDEAHCISTWGHDFRPSYRHILQFCRALKQKQPQLRILGLTATADQQTEKDIVQQLSSPEEPVHVLREKMDRPNLHLSVLGARGTAEKLTLCQTLLGMQTGNGLIYCATRENVELVAEYLAGQGLSVIGYHAGLESEEKRAIQTAFAKNSYRVIVATTALGMGIDKKDLRFVMHFDIPGSITAYYQEVGRAGRDGLIAEGILLYDKVDRKVQDYFIDSALPTAEDFSLVLEAVRSAVTPPNLTAIKRMTGLHPTRVTIVCAELLDQNFLQKTSIRGVQVYELADPLPNISVDLSRYTTQHKVKTQELHKIIQYAEQQEKCRMAILRAALGDKAPAPCNRCDVCKQTVREITADAKKAKEWLSDRPVIIAGAKTNKISSGLSLFDSHLASPLFFRFMKERAVTDELDPEILKLLFKQAAMLPRFGAIAILPSRTWKAGVKYAEALATHFNVPLWTDLFTWQTIPPKRQGELLNNDQRHANVHECMTVNKSMPELAAPLVIFDDYLGSGSTLKEAARALRKVWKTTPIVPLTIATVKWRLGKPGLVV